MAEKKIISKKLMTQKEYAAKRNVSKQYIGKLVKEGVLSLSNGKVDSLQADGILEARREHPERTNLHLKAERTSPRTSRNRHCGQRRTQWIIYQSGRKRQ